MTGVGDDPSWFKRAVFYEVLVRSFNDSNADGVWTISPALTHAAHLAGSGKVTLNLAGAQNGLLRYSGHGAYLRDRGLLMCPSDVAGTLLTLLVDVTPAWGPAYTLLAFIIVIIGGLGSMPGALAGGVLADRLASQYRGGRMMTQALGLFCGALNPRGTPACDICTPRAI